MPLPAVGRLQYSVFKEKRVIGDNQILPIGVRISRSPSSN
jgi:hypothetical protein